MRIGPRFNGKNNSLCAIRHAKYRSFAGIVAGQNDLAVTIVT
jgi:hypothetical protein